MAKTDTQNEELTEVDSGETDQCILCGAPLKVYHCIYRGQVSYEQCYSEEDIANGLDFVECTHEVL
jgi:hypothetical protein